MWPFKKPDEAGKRYNEARRCGRPGTEEFDPGKSIHLLEKAVMLTQDNKKYRRQLDLMKANIAGSSTFEHPKPKDVYRFLLTNLEAQGTWLVIFRRHQDASQWVEVLLRKNTLLTFRYPYEEDPNRLISNLGLHFPTGYVLSMWQRHKYAQFSGPRCPHPELADTIDELFTKLLGAHPDYDVQGVIEATKW